MAHHQPQQGIAAVELALVLPVCVFLLALMLFVGKVLYCYEAAAKAAHDSSRYLSSISKLDMKNPAQIANHVALAQQLIATELNELQLTPYPPSVQISCGDGSCDGYLLPPTVTVSIHLRLVDNMFSGVTGWDALSVRINVQLPYVGA